MSGLSSLTDLGLGLLSVVSSVLSYGAMLIEQITGLTLF